MGFSFIKDKINVVYQSYIAFNNIHDPERYDVIIGWFALHKGLNTFIWVCPLICLSRLSV